MDTLIVFVKRRQRLIFLRGIVKIRPVKYVLVLYSDENTCYNIAMAQVSVAQEGKLPEMHERLIILRELLTRAAPSSRGHCAFSS